MHREETDHQYQVGYMNPLGEFDFGLFSALASGPVYESDVDGK